MKIAILHDYFDKKGGGERLVINLAKSLGADVFTGYVDKEKTFEMDGINVAELGVNRRLPEGLKQIKIAKKFMDYNFQKYDCYIISGIWCITAAKDNHPNIFYCHTPPRYMYDLREYFMKEYGMIKKIAMKRLISYWEEKDKFYTNHMDIICTNSKNVKNRIKSFYGIEAYKRSKVVYTGIETGKFKNKKSEEFYLATQRLDKLKRVDLIINAFKSMPERRLIITGTGPEEKKLRLLAEDCENIEFLGSVGEERLIDLYSRCNAVICAPLNEDLGLSSIESQASGKPVIAVRDGGLMETVIEGKTGVFFKPNAESLKKAVKKCEKIKWDKNIIMKNAKKYDIIVFTNTIKKMIKEAMKNSKVKNTANSNGLSKRIVD